MVGGNDTWVLVMVVMVVVGVHGESWVEVIYGAGE